MTRSVGWGVIGVALALAVASMLFLNSSRTSISAENSQPKPAALAGAVLFASPGKVEGVSDATQIGAGADGVLKAVFVKEGEFVPKGALLGEIACDDLTADLQTAVAEADMARDSRARLLRGARYDERKIAAEQAAAASATFEQLKSRFSMLRPLYRKQEISRAAYEKAKQELSVAGADLQAAILKQKLLAAPPLPEDRARADAQLAAAEGRVKSTQAEISKCLIVAPIQGTVLRVYAQPGESFSTVTPRPLFSLADTSRRRIKAEVDERDVEKLSVGEDVIVQPDGFEKKRLAGRVASISAVMGSKSIDAGDPPDRSGRDVLDATINLDDATQPLPIGLRVTVQFLSTHSREHLNSKNQ
jgi:HlyD family secretion protein